jgi:hypothetical protein
VCAWRGGLFSCTDARGAAKEAPRSAAADEEPALDTSPPRRIDRFCRIRLSAESASSSSLPLASERALADETSRSEAGRVDDASGPRLAARSIDRVVESSTEEEEEGVDLT